VSDDLREIIEKCEQYWNEPRIEPPEYHAVLDFIHVRAHKATKRNAELLGLLREVREHVRCFCYSDCVCPYGKGNLFARVRNICHREQNRKSR
jgi:hypothetical protein